MTDAAPVTGDPSQITAIVHALTAMQTSARKANADLHSHRARLDAHWKSQSSGRARTAMDITAQRLKAADTKLGHIASVLNRYAAELETALSQQKATTSSPSDAQAIAQHIDAQARRCASLLHELSAPPAPVQVSPKVDAITATTLNAAAGRHKRSS
jgi:uncharacterized protein YukE